MNQLSENHAYRLRLADDGNGEPKDVEFDARSSDVALSRTAEMCGDRPVVMFEDGREIAKMKRTQGVWHVGKSDQT